MLPDQSLPDKPVTRRLRPELTRLPVLTPARLLVRRVLRALLRLLVWLTLRPAVADVEKIPLDRPFLAVTNHLGDADLVLGLAYSPVQAEIVAKSELYDLPLLGWLMDAYGVIWLHRGQPDRRAVRAVLQAFEQGRAVAIAPEGRESVTGALEEGLNGAAYMALKGEVPIVPIAFTGTENRRVYGSLRRLRRTRVSMVVGDAFDLKTGKDYNPEAGQKRAISQGTREIMLRLAALLPPEYRGVYSAPDNSGPD